MARYQYVYALKPMGPHRPLADAVFSGMRETCSTCAGDGILTVDGGVRWRSCPACEGTGGRWTRPDEEVEAARRAVLECHPDAAATPTPAFLSRMHFYNLATGEMISSPKE